MFSDALLYTRSQMDKNLFSMILKSLHKNNCILCCCSAIVLETTEYFVAVCYIICQRTPSLYRLLWSLYLSLFGCFLDQSLTKNNQKRKRWSSLLLSNSSAWRVFLSSMRRFHHTSLTMLQLLSQHTTCCNSSCSFLLKLFLSVPSLQLELHLL